MAVTVKSIIDSVSITLNDTDVVRRWPESELLGYFNEAQKEIVNHNLGEGATAAVIATVAGTRQTLPAGAIELFEVTHNMGAFANQVAGDAITPIERNQLDTQVPGWHAAAPTGSFDHYIFDGRDRKSFDLYPPAAGTEAVAVKYAATPAIITGLGAGGNLNRTETIGVSDDYDPAIKSYILYRALSKDAEYNVANAQIAIGHYQAFANSIGIEANQQATVNPNNNAAPYTHSPMPDAR